MINNNNTFKIQCARGNSLFSKLAHSGRWMRHWPPFERNISSMVLSISNNFAILYMFEFHKKSRSNIKLQIQLNHFRDLCKVPSARNLQSHRSSVVSWFQWGDTLLHVLIAVNAPIMRMAYISSYIIPVQKVPVHPNWQLHVKLVPLWEQNPKFAHGFGLHKFTGTENDIKNK